MTIWMGFEVCNVNVAVIIINYLVKARLKEKLTLLVCFNQSFKIWYLVQVYFYIMLTLLALYVTLMNERDIPYFILNLRELDH